MLVEARALQVAQDESDLVATGVRNLSPRWKTLKSEFLLRPADYVVETFDEFERLLQDKVSVKDAISDSTMYLEQNIVTNGSQNGKQGGEGGSRPKGGGKPKGE